MPEGILATVDDGFATIDFVDPSLRGPALAQLVELGGAESIETITRSGPRRQYRVPEGNAREVGLLDDSEAHPRGAVDHSAEEAALTSEGGVRGAFTPGNAGVDTGAAAALKAANPNVNAGADAADWHTPTAEYTSANKFVGDTTVTEARAAAAPAFTGAGTSHGGGNATEVPTHRDLIDRVKAFEKANPKGEPRGEAQPHAPVQALNTGLKSQDSALADDPGARPDEGGQARSVYSSPQAVRSGKAPEGAESGQEAPGEAESTAGTSEAPAAPSEPQSGAQEVKEIPGDQYPEGEPTEDWRRPELDSYALDKKGLDTTELPNKKAVLKAISEAK
ncbi:hypothetical protein I5G62_gp17 [Mycobacterium phage CRB2]|uniref:Uncharacterized protein n=1 Tax=Mycobacterium phage CRB2 TaxID=2483623 RepID=A0A455LN97_9CAUD|nr:hypothetical protein I5G62_gp17 [Mycobacterium phage CRB2]AYP70003.1 hypothetical protein CRB2_17 [Mycobacterium phage CRB2]